MPRLGERGERWRLLHAPADGDSVSAWVRRYIEAMRVMGRSRSALVNQTATLARFNEWCVERGIGSPREITKPVLERWQRHLFYYRKPNDEPLSLKAQRVALQHLRAFFRWMARHNHLPHNPASDLDLPLAPARVLPVPLTQVEVEQVLAAIDIAAPLGLRDRAILETMYSTGLRRMEVANLSLYDLDTATRALRVRQGKGRKDRVVPIGERALAWVARYLREVRPALLVDTQTTALFLTVQGQPCTPDGLTAMVRERFDRAGIVKAGSCHLFRHTMATLMLENGADVRFIQEILGHAALSTTQVYTHVSIAKLRAVHDATHPAARLERRAEASGDEGPDAA